MNRSRSSNRAGIGDGVLPAAPFGLTDKQREVLRLLARGHDAKSAAAVLGVSVHTVRERLREGRAKTGASSSRSAARLLADCEGTQLCVSEKGVVAPGTITADARRRLHPGAADGSRLLSRWGMPMLVSALTAAAIVAATRPAADHPVPSTAPHVIATNPVAGAIVAPGPLALSVTFDRPMRRQSYSFVQKSAATYPDCGANRPVQSADGRTFTMQCRIQAGHRYEVWFNGPPYDNFKGDDGLAAIPYRLRFRTR